MARLIDKDEAIKALDEKEKYDDSRILSDHQRILEELPEVDAEPVKHGKWEFYDFTSPTLQCSVCKGLAGYDCCGDYHSVASDFCPNCGARMDGEGE